MARRWGSVLLLAFVLQMARGQPRACPQACICFAATQTMDCSPRPDLTGIDTLFTSIPQAGPIDTRVIIMTGNALSSLPAGSFAPYPALEAVVLNDNPFTEVPSEGFSNLPITNLTFDGNPLQLLGEGAFGNLTMLEHLSLRRLTGFESIDGVRVLAGLANLRTLLLEDSMLTNLPADFLTSTPNLQTLSLRNNSMQTLPEDFFSSPTTLTSLDLSLNPWSCDCFLEWLRRILDTSNILANDMDTLCHWPPPHNTPPMTPLSQLPLNSYQCFEPTITVNATDTTLFSNRSLSIPCGVSSAPFPAVTWLKDGVPVNFTSRVSIRRYDATLRFQSQDIADSGRYQCLLVNSNGTAESSVATITVLESTCFDTVLTRAHETDRDCGGPLCVPCNITMGCLLDRDCAGELVCLYSHLLPSSLHYISPHNPDAYTCAEPSVPPLLLEDILRSKLPLNLSLAGVSAETNATTLHNAMHDFLALQLEVPRRTIYSVRLSTVEKIAQPLVQVWFSLHKTLLGEQAENKLTEQIESGALRATVRREERANFVDYRLNL